MGKRDHGRLVHELRDALIARGFEPSRVTQLRDGAGVRSVRAPGFALQKHSDSKSVRLSHRAGRVTVPGPAADWADWQARGAAQMRLLVRYHGALEHAGFVCVGVDSRDPMNPYSLWRRA
jgi:hypothetical protein